MRLLKTLDNMHHTLSIWLEIKFWQPSSKTCNSTMCEVCILPVWVCHVHSARWEDCIVHGVQCVLYRLISVYFKSKSSGNKEDFDIKSNLIYIIYLENCSWLALDMITTCSRPSISTCTSTVWAEHWEQEQPHPEPHGPTRRPRSETTSITLRTK